MNTEATWPARRGPRPETTRRIPHSQLTQHGPDAIVAKLHDWCFALPGVNNEHSGISVPGARALVLHEGCACNPDAFMVGREFAHIHPHPDSGSMHVKLAAEDARNIVEAGWGEDHFLVTMGRYPPGLIMVFSPRDDEELEVVKRIVARSYEHATGKPPEQKM
ncbi:phospholipase [Roseibium sp.]|uniref:luciferase domain-containing protein n=1 Tax=Roseibium sp. TaxID=1936156 RepID=UPI003BAD0249